MTDALGISTILKCLDVAEAEIGLKADGWKGNAQAESDFKWFLENQAAWRAGLKNFDQESLKGFATRDFAKLLEVMEKWEMKVEPPQQAEEGSVYTISKLLEEVSWTVIGERVLRPGMYPEFSLKNDVGFWANGYSDEPLISILTENGDTVWITRSDEELKGLALLHRVHNLVAEKEVWSGKHYSGVHIPCIKTEIKPSLSWLVRTMKNQHWFIADAKQLIRFGMNETGFIVLEETSAGFVFECYIPPAKPYIVCPKGEGFIFGRTRPGVKFPISAFHLTNEAYKDPGNLKDVVK